MAQLDVFYIYQRVKIYFTDINFLAQRLLYLQYEHKGVHENLNQTKSLCEEQTMLNITDLTVSKELDSKAMAGVRGGTSDLERLSAMFDFSTSIVNKVADIKQAFGFSIAQSNTGALTNNQTIVGGNGVVFAPVHQTQTQANSLSLSDIGNALVG
jgi:hypothetical protein